MRGVEVVEVGGGGGGRGARTVDHEGGRLVRRDRVDDLALLERALLHSLGHLLVVLRVVLRVLEALAHVLLHLRLELVLPLLGGVLRLEREVEVG